MNPEPERGDSRDGLLAHPDVTRLSRSFRQTPGRVVTPDRAVRLAAVAAILRVRDAAEPADLLLIRRAQAPADPWSGHVAFPGGRMETADQDLAATAIRETREEIGIGLARRDILGALDDIYPRTPALPPILVRPFVVAISDDVTIVPSDEIAGHIWVPLDALIDVRNWGTAPIAIRTLGVQERPVFRYQDFVVWGMTEGALRELTLRLSAPAP